jgi:hypothetical protein
MLEVLYVVAAGLGYMLYRQLTTDPPPQDAATELIAPSPRVVYQPMSKLLLRDRIDAVPSMEGVVQLGHLGTPRMDMVDPSTGIRYPIYTKDAPTTIANLRS